MSLSEIKSHINDLSDSWEEFKRVNERRLEEIENKGGSDSITTEHLDKLNKIMNECKDSLRRIETSSSRPSLDGVSICDSEHKSLLEEYLRKGFDSDLREWQKKYVNPLSDSAGFLLTHQAADVVKKRIDELSMVRRVASVEKISTDYLSIIRDNQDFIVEWGDAINDHNNHILDLNVLNIFTNEMHAQIRVTQRFLDDSMIDIEDWLAEKMSYSFAKAEDRMFIQGEHGQNNPTGILSYPDGSGDFMITRVPAGDANGITSDSLIGLYYSLDEVYAENATFMMNRETVNYLRSLKSDQTGQYIWQPGLAQDNPDTLMGVPIVQSSHFPTMGTGKIVMAIADFNRAYKIIDRNNISVIRDPFSTKPYVTFYANKRVGGQVVDFKAIKLMVMN